MVSESIGATWIVISWNIPSLNPDIVSYIVTAVSDNGTVSVVVDESTTEVNMTGLKPGTEYTLTVVSVSVAGDTSSPSDPLIVMTLARPGKQPYFVYFQDCKMTLSTFSSCGSK